MTRRVTDPWRCFWTGVALGLVAALASSAHAAFEIRAGGAHQTAHIPVGMRMLDLPIRPAFGRPGPLPLPAPPQWRCRMLHLAPFGFDEVAYDAITVESALDGGQIEFACARLRAGAYAEWEVTCCARLPAGLLVSSSLLQSRPERSLSDEAGVRPLAGWTGSLGWRTTSDQRLGFELWFADAWRTGDDGRLGLRSAVTTSVAVQAGQGLTFSGTRCWTGDPARDDTRAAIAWTLDGKCAVGREWGARGGDATWIAVGSGPMEGVAWLATVAPDLPATPGLSLAWRSNRLHEADQGVPREAKGETAIGARVSTAPCSIMVSPIETFSSLGLSESDERYDGGLWLGSEPLLSIAATDSLLGAVDSLDERPADWIDRDPVRSPRVPVLRPRLPLLVRAIRTDDLRSLAGIDSARAFRLAGHLRATQVDQLGALTLPDSVRRDLVLAAPILRVALPPSEEARRPERSERGDIIVRWRRSLRMRLGHPTRQGENARLTWSGSGRRARVEFSRADVSSADDVRGLLEFGDPARWRVATGRGGVPVRWGGGVVARARPVRLASSADEALSVGPSRPVIDAADLVSPSTGGGAPFAAVAVTPGRPNWRMLAAARDRDRWIGIVHSDRGTQLGALLRVSGRSPALSVDLRRAGGCGETGLEVCAAPGGPLRAAARWSGARWRTGPGSLWWDSGCRGPVSSFERTRPRDVDSEAIFDDQQVAWLRGGWSARRVRASIEGSGGTRIDPITKAGTRTRQVRLNAHGEWNRARIDARVEAYGRHGAKLAAVEEPLGGIRDNGLRRWRWRGMIDRPLGLFRAPGTWRWGGEWGGQRTVRSASDRDSRANSDWVGLWSALSGRVVDLSCGLLQCASYRETLALAPTWAPGAHASLPGRGTWLAGRVVVRAGPLGVRAGWIFPYAGAGGVKGRRASRVNVEAEWRLLAPSGGSAR